MLQPTALTLQRLAAALAPHGLRPPPIEPGPPWSGWAADLIDLAVALRPCRASRLLLEEASGLPSAAAAARRALLGTASEPGR
jgi:hypothetical protein